jgi:rhodanese-related sulfurtransferase
MSFQQIEVSELILDHPVVDVREPDEYTSGHIPGARHIPVGDVPDRVADFVDYDTVYMVCHGGGRSGRACDYLSQQPELSHVKFINVMGGTSGWIALGREVVQGDQPS